MEFSSIEAVIDFAIGKEREANEFYKTWSEKVDKPAMKEVFLEFAAEEEKHEKLLLGLKGGETTSFKAAEAHDLHITDHLVEVEATGDMDYRGALKLAIQIGPVDQFLQEGQIRSEEAGIEGQRARDQIAHEGGVADDHQAGLGRLLERDLGRCRSLFVPDGRQGRRNHGNC